MSCFVEYNSSNRVRMWYFAPRSRSQPSEIWRPEWKPLCCIWIMSPETLHLNTYTHLHITLICFTVCMYIFYFAFVFVFVFPFAFVFVFVKLYRSPLVWHRLSVRLSPVWLTHIPTSIALFSQQCQRACKSFKTSKTKIQECKSHLWQMIWPLPFVPADGTSMTIAP